MLGAAASFRQHGSVKILHSDTHSDAGFFFFLFMLSVFGFTVLLNLG